MEHRAVDQLQGIAKVSAEPLLLSTRRARLERWAEILERDPGRLFATLPEVELVPWPRRGTLRSDNSPLTLAYADSLLRASGLTGDTYGEGRRFFGLREGQVHRLLCSCVNGRQIRADLTARRLRGIADYRMERWAVGLAAGAASVPGLMFLFG
ncbi:hypothetical protein [Methylobacterium durans]|uniref:Uncharacterized protein n=1 Tax=Methylobacterium durans TaxID=2202825 RepID=A0A2U8WEZ8_9HYPH|nr:hypothetical protein [Methylobacterium durans]AWN43852.1 hypothetical protein DK389_29190 [Methylobacterium durans]